MNKKIGLGIVGVIVLAGVFYAGMTYGGNNVRAAINSRSQGLSTGNFAGRMGGNRAAVGFTAGQIIAKDANSITVQLMAGGGSQGGSATPTTGGSKIVFVDNNTKVTKSVDGTISDLAIGAQISVTGTPNTDGSVNAQAVQIRPIAPAGK